MNHWLTLFAYLLGGMTLKWVLDVFFLRHVYRENEHKLNVREAEFTTLKHEHSQALTDLKNRLTELDATSKAKLLAEGNLAKANSNLTSLRPHVLRVEEDLSISRNREIELVELVAVRDRELQSAAARTESIESALLEQSSTGEALRQHLAEAQAASAILAESETGLRMQLADALQELAIRAGRIGELGGSLEAHRLQTNTLEAAVQSREAQIADSRNRFAALDAERESVADTLKLTDRELSLARGEIEVLTQSAKEAQEAARRNEARSPAPDGPHFQEPDPAWIHRISDIEAELSAVSESHALLETELIRERQRSASLEEQLRSADLTTKNANEFPMKSPLGAVTEAKLLAEIDELNRERNTLAAELAALKSANPPAMAGTSRKRKGRVVDAELFPTLNPAPGESAPADGPSASEVVPEFSSQCPQHLSDVNGIGSIFEQRLYVSGVGSFWELSQLTDRTLTEVLELDATQREHFDFAATRADAARLARETQSEGRKWTGDQPDDLEPLEGIGAAIEKRLYNAGICTYAALAAASEETLAEICPLAKYRGADYARWIEQARQRLGREED